MAIKADSRKNLKVTFSLPAELVDTLRRLVRDGEAPSQSRVVTVALEKEIRSRRRALLREEFREAALDPDFLGDVDATMLDFATADDQMARSIR